MKIFACIFMVAVVATIVQGVVATAELEKAMGSDDSQPEVEGIATNPNVEKTSPVPSPEDQESGTTPGTGTESIGSSTEISDTTMLGGYLVNGPGMNNSLPTRRSSALRYWFNLVGWLILTLLVIFVMVCRPGIFKRERDHGVDDMPQFTGRGMTEMEDFVSRESLMEFGIGEEEEDTV